LRAGPHLEQVVDDHVIAGLQSRQDRPVRADPVAGSHRNRLRLAFCIDDEDERRPLQSLHGYVKSK